MADKHCIYSGSLPAVARPGDNIPCECGRSLKITQKGRTPRHTPPQDNSPRIGEIPPAPLPNPAICPDKPWNDPAICTVQGLLTAPGELHGPVAPCPHCGHDWDRQGEPPLFAVEIKDRDSYYNHMTGHGISRSNPASDERAAILAMGNYTVGTMRIGPAPWAKLAAPKLEAASRGDWCEWEADMSDMPLSAPDADWRWNLENWHGGQFDPIYALGASGWNEHVTRQDGISALCNLSRDAARSDGRPSGDGRKLPDEDRAELQECIDGLEAWLAKTEPHPTACTSAHCRPGVGILGARWERRAKADLAADAAAARLTRPQV